VTGGAAFRINGRGRRRRQPCGHGRWSAIPELVIGPFGAAVVHVMPSSRLIRHGARWETRTSDGWVPTDDPVEAAARDADRVRRWLGLADLDFVVRVYAAVVVDDRTIQRSPYCATITPEQIPGWIAAAATTNVDQARRDRLVAVAQALPATGATGTPNW
jgi:hypothetical protein